jgi:hypothetical protein
MFLKMNFTSKCIQILSFYRESHCALLQENVLQENTMDAEENENWLDQHTADTTEWGAGSMDRKER